MLPMFISQKAVSRIRRGACSIHKRKYLATWDCQPLYAMYHKDLFVYSLPNMFLEMTYDKRYLREPMEQWSIDRKSITQTFYNVTRCK